MKKSLAEKMIKLIMDNNRLVEAINFARKVWPNLSLIDARNRVYKIIMR